MTIRNVRIWNPQQDLEVTAQVKDNEVVRMIDSKTREPLLALPFPVDPRNILCIARGLQIGLALDLLVTPSGQPFEVAYFLET